MSERKELLRRVNVAGGHIISADTIVGPWATPLPSISLVRSLLGDRPIVAIEVPVSGNDLNAMSEVDFAQIKSKFPESTVVSMGMHGWSAR